MAVALSNTAVERLKVEVATCTRLLNHENILGYSGHVSVRLPDRKTLLLQSFDASRTELTPEDLYILDFDGEVLDGPKDARPINEIEIHTEIMRARDDVNAVLHYHPETATLFTMIEGVELVPLKNHAMRWMSGIPVHDDSWHIDSPESGRALAATLGPHHAALIRAHGAVIVAESIPALLVDTVHFEENARAMFEAARLGRVKPLSRAEAERFHNNFKRNNHVSKLWRYYLGRGVEAGAVPRDWGKMLMPRERA
jgi:ribulose-5-phosphate 4-epimerase/fuculose-1-phosphate aldolase